MDQDKTFNRSRQTPVDEMLSLLHNQIRMSPVMSVGNMVFNRNDYYDSFSFHLESVRLLKKHGWDIEDFQQVLEKRSLLKIIKDYNDSIVFPTEIIERAKEFFPNIKFIPAHLDLGEDNE